MSKQIIFQAVNNKHNQTVIKQAGSVPTCSTTLRFPFSLLNRSRKKVSKYPTALCISRFPLYTNTDVPVSLWYGRRWGNKGFIPLKKIAGRKWLKFFLKRHSQLRIKNRQNLSIYHAISLTTWSIKNFFLKPQKMGCRLEVRGWTKQDMECRWMQSWRCPSGYIKGDLFLKYGKKFVSFLKKKHLLPSQKKIMKLLDLHKSHLFNYQFMQLMKKNNIEVCGFPSSCTHMLRPLDDIPFAHFKNVYQRELLIMNRQLCGNRMGKQQLYWSRRVQCRDN